MVRNFLGWHIKTNRPLPSGEGVYAACNGGLLPPYNEERRALPPTCAECKKIWKSTSS